MAETQKFKPKVLNDDEIKDLLIRVNQLCIDLKNVYYNYNDNVITDFEYDQLEQGFKIADKYNKHTNWDKEVSFNVLLTPGLPVDVLQVEDISQYKLYVRQCYNTIKPMLGHLVLQSMEKANAELKALLNKYGIKEEELEDE